MHNRIAAPRQSGPFSTPAALDPNLVCSEDSQPVSQAKNVHFCSAPYCGWQPLVLHSCLGLSYANKSLPRLSLRRSRGADLLAFPSIVSIAFISLLSTRSSHHERSHRNGSFASSSRPNKFRRFSASHHNLECRGPRPCIRLPIRAENCYLGNPQRARTTCASATLQPVWQWQP